MLLKAEVAELLLPTVIVNLAGRKDLEAGLHKTISLQVVFLSCFGWFLVISFEVYFTFRISRIFRHYLFKTDHSLGGNYSEGVSVERIVSLVSCLYSILFLVLK